MIVMIICCLVKPSAFLAAASPRDPRNVDEGRQICFFGAISFLSCSFPSLLLGGIFEFCSDTCLMV